MARTDARKTGRGVARTIQVRGGSSTTASRGAGEADARERGASTDVSHGGGARAGSDAAAASEPSQASRSERRLPQTSPGAWRESPGLWPGEYWFPQIEVFERGDEFVVRADLPGLQREDVTVEVTDDALVIHGERRSEREEKSGRGFYRSERSYGSFHRRIGIPEGVASDSATARFKNGVLEVTMRTTKPPTERGRRIDVEGDDGGAS